MSDVRANLAEAFVELSDVLADDFDLVEFLNTLTSRCVELLPVDTAGILIADEQDALRPAGAATEPRIPHLLEIELSSGPGAECVEKRRPLVNLDLRAERTRWPHFVAAVLEAGFRSLHVLPMRLRDDVIGALSLFGVAPDPLADCDLRVGQALADAATIRIQLQRRLQRAERLSNQLQGALTSRIVIEQAKGIIAEHGRLDMDHAFERLRSYARSHNRRLTELAQAVVARRLNLDELLA